MEDFKPAGWPTVCPRIITPDVAGVVGFLKAVFGASGELVDGRPAEMRIAESVIMVSDGDGQRGAMPAFLYVYVADVDQVYERAVTVGAEVIEGPVNMPYGDRRATVRDPWGNTWQIATRQT